ncbi:unannotated protein [freshwater metagenome]|uniref:Unannotated protein n=1 Tax=freshwater metagenome TaxID=449393 RepID=A0A6J7Q2B7_9ZZZZ
MLACDQVLNDVRPDPVRPARSGGHEGTVAFVEISRIETEEDRERLLDFGQRPHTFSTLVIHNGDFRPRPDYLEALAQSFSRVFAVNVIDESAHVRALPIGLPNFHHHGASILEPHIAAWASTAHGGLRSAGRSLPVLASFRCGTNRDQRVPLAELCTRRGFPNQEISSRDLFAALDRSLFVLSPPGNGPDCHRTWEAIYHGAVPVVLRGHLAPRFIDQLPIHVVDDWDEVLDRTTSELQSLFDELTNRPRRLASMQHWIETFRRATS